MCKVERLMLEHQRKHKRCTLIHAYIERMLTSDLWMNGRHHGDTDSEDWFVSIDPFEVG